MANTYFALAKSVITTNTASITFASIPQTYTDLLIVISARCNGGVIGSWYTMRFNGQNTNYNNVYILGSGAAATSATSTTSIMANQVIPGTSATANTFSNVQIYLPSYTGNKYKNVGTSAVGENNATTAYIYAGYGISSNTAATASIEIDCDGYSFVSGSRFDLYGIKNS
jgi:hypothetical protein